MLDPLVIPSITFKGCLQLCIFENKHEASKTNRIIEDEIVGAAPAAAAMAMDKLPKGV